MKIIIIGAGFGGLGSAALLAKAGHEVTIFEKNQQVGGRAGSFTAKGFRFDTGPSWYLMPEVFEKFFANLDEKIEDHIKIKRLRPHYRVTFKDYGQSLDINDDLQQTIKTFESIEPGAGLKLKDYVNRAEQSYKLAIDKVLYRQLPSPSLIANLPSIPRGSLHSYVSCYVKDPRLQQILEYPAMFLGVSPYKAPAVYSLLSHVDFNQGVFYPEGGIFGLTQALERLGREYGVTVKLNSPVEQVLVKGDRAYGVKVNGKTYEADVVISNADRYHTETALLKPAERDHGQKYWQERNLAPSALLLYLGVDKQYKSLRHHNLLFSGDWQRNFQQIFEQPAWPDDPSFYVCAPSKTDKTVAPKGSENLFVLVPVAAGLKYTAKQLEAFTEKILETIETHLKLPDLRQHIVYQKVFAVKDFEDRFNSWQGSALGLSHTFKQSAWLRPGLKSKKVKGLYYVGANTQPGIGLPMTLISAGLVSDLIGSHIGGLQPQASPFKEGSGQTRRA